MARHLDYLRYHRSILRLHVNAAEALLINGDRQPEDRGVCRHLLDKVDRATIDAALLREPVRSDVTARARLLAGAVAITRDVGVLLTYLETVTQLASRQEQSQVFLSAVQRIAFEGVSASRLGRLLGLLLQIFEGPQRTGVLLGLLADPAFRQAYDNAATAGLDETTRATVGPLRHLASAAFLEGPAAAADPAVRPANAVGLVMALPPPALRELPAPLKAGVLQMALDLEVPAAVLDGVVATVLPALPAGSREHGRLSLRLAARLLRTHQDARAAAVLAPLAAVGKGQDRTAARWATELARPRLGRVALEQATHSATLRRGFWLDGQQDVWVRTAAAADEDALAAEAELQRTLALPGVARVVLHQADQPVALLAMAAWGQVLNAAGLPHHAGGRALVVSACLRVLHALSLAGVALPDARLERFLWHPASHSVTLADLCGARTCTPEDAAAALRGAARSLLAAAGGDTVALETALSAHGLAAVVVALEKRGFGQGAAGAG